MTSYLRPLRKIKQSIPKSGIVISTTLDNGHSRYKQFVSFKSRKQKQAPAPLKINLRSRKAAPKVIPLKVMVKQVNGMLKVEVPDTDPSDTGVFTDLEKMMFRDEDMTQESRPRLSVFQRLTKEPQPRVSVFQRLGEIHPKSQKNRKWKLKRQRVLMAKQVDENVEGFASTNCTSIEED